MAPSTPDGFLSGYPISNEEAPNASAHRPLRIKYVWPGVERIVLSGRPKVLLGLAVLVLAVAVGWQIASCEIANLELQADMRDIAAQVASRIGLEAPNSDEDLRNAVIHKAEEHDIQLEPGQVTVGRTGSGKALAIYLAADYRARVNLLVYSFALHFTPSSAK
jgi:hypothetical protein